MTLNMEYIILNQGVAVAMLIYFIFRFEKILKDNTQALIELKKEIRNGK